MPIINGWNWFRKHYCKTQPKIWTVQPSYEFSGWSPGIIKAYSMAYQSRMNTFQTAMEYICVTAFWRFSGDAVLSYVFEFIHSHCCADKDRNFLPRFRIERIFMHPEILILVSLYRKANWKWWQNTSWFYWLIWNVTLNTEKFGERRNDVAFLFMALFRVPKRAYKY